MDRIPYEQTDDAYHESVLNYFDDSSFNWTERSIESESPTLLLTPTNDESLS